MKNLNYSYIFSTSHTKLKKKPHKYVIPSTLQFLLTKIFPTYNKQAVAQLYHTFPCRITIKSILVSLLIPQNREMNSTYLLFTPNTTLYIYINLSRTHAFFPFVCIVLKWLDNIFYTCHVNRKAPHFDESGWTSSNYVSNDDKRLLFSVSSYENFLFIE